MNLESLITLINRAGAVPYSGTDAPNRLWQFHTSDVERLQGLVLSAERDRLHSLLSTYEEQLAAQCRALAAEGLEPAAERYAAQLDVIRFIKTLNSEGLGL